MFSSVLLFVLGINLASSAAATPGRLCLDSQNWVRDTMPAVVDDCDAAIKVASRKNQSMLYLSKAEALGALGQEERADAALQLALDADPKNAVAWCRLGWLSLVRFDPKSIDAYDHCVRLNRRSETIAGRAIALRVFGRLAEAKKDAVAATFLNPNDPLGLLALGDALAQENQCTKAIGKYELAIVGLRNYPHFFGVVASIGKAGCLEALRRMPEAEIAYSDAIRFGPEVPVAYFARGHFLQSRGETERAVKDFSRAISLNPKYQDALEARAQSYFILGQDTLAYADRATLDSLSSVR